MKKSSYFLIRLDDACPTMNNEKWARIENILDKYNIKPLVGIIPNNNDVELAINDYDSSFWYKTDNWQKKGWSIALHGYDHVYLTDKRSANLLYNETEFEGLSLEDQKIKIAKGLAILNKNNLDVNYFFAPNHTFDDNTLNALLSETKIRKISDTIARFPYRKGDIVFYPQQFGEFRDIKIHGYWTFCFHPNTIDEQMFDQIENFIKNHSDKFISFENVDVKSVKSKPILDILLSFSFFAFRTIRSLLFFMRRNTKHI